MSCEDASNSPPYNEYSSLNSILMSVLYSENSRDLIIKKAKSWDSSNKFRLIIKKIVNKNKLMKDISLEISSLKPDDIFLENMYFLKEKENKDLFRKDLISSKLNKINWIEDYIIDLYRSLGLNCLDIYYMEDKKIYLNLFKFMRWVYKDEKISTDLNLFPLIKIQETNIIPKNPDIFIVFHKDLNKSINDKYMKPFYKTSSKTKEIFLKFEDKSKKYEIFKEIEEEMRIDDDIYILDSIMVNNSIKSFVGFRCNEDKYIYTNFSGSFENPCSVNKFNWEINKGKFCFNPLKCDIIDDFIDIDDLCIDFEKGDKTLIYIKKDISKIKIPEIPDIPDIEIIKMIDNIKGMTISNLTEIVKSYDPSIVSSSSKRNELERSILRYYIINYNKLKQPKEEIKEEEPVELPQ
jgi:hypothetical protein